MDGQRRFSVDRGWAWVVCAACFSIQFVLFGIIQSYGTIFIALIREFNTSESEAAWVGSLAYGLIFLSGPLSTALIEHFGCRKIACLGCLVCSFGLLTSSFAPSISWMYLTFSIVWGLGASLSFFSSLLVLRFFFYHKLSLGNGIAMTGSAAGTLLLNLALGKMNDSLGWRVSWRILSAFTAGSCVCGCAFLQPLDVCSASRQWNQLEKVNLWKKLRRTVDLRPWKNKVFLVYLTAQSFMLFGYFVPYVHLVRLAETRGIPTHQGSLLVGYLSVSQIFGKLLFGRLADHRLFNKVFLLSFAGFMLALSTTCATLARNYGELIAFSLIFGFFDGAVVVVIPVITLLIVGREQMAYAFGGMYAVLAIPLTIGPCLSAVLYDYTGSYSVAFYASSSLVAVGVFLMYVVHRLMLSMVVRTNVWQATGENNKSLVKDGAESIHVPHTGSAGGLGGMCLADVTSQARDHAVIDNAQIDAQSMSLSLVFPSQIFCDPLSHLSYSVTNLSNATLSHDINLMAPSENGSTASNVQSSPDIHSLVSVGESLTLKTEETKAENDELLRIALENLAKKEKETAPLGSTNQEQPEFSDNVSLTEQGIDLVSSKKQEANATSNLSHADVRDGVNEETEILREPQNISDDLHDKIGIKSPVAISAVSADNKANSNTELEAVRIPPPPETPRKNANLLVDLGDTNTFYMVNVENMDHSHLTSTSQSVPESLLSLQESLRSQQDTSINSSMLLDHCMFSDSAQVSALSERLEEVAAHRRSLEEAELAALLSNAEGTNLNLHNEIFSEADEEILQVRLPPPPSSSKRRSHTSSVSYDSPVPSLVDQNQVNCTNLEQNGNEVDMICDDEKNRIVSPDNEEAKDVHLIDFITKEQGNNNQYIYSPNRQENWLQSETKSGQNVFPSPPTVSEAHKTWQQLENPKTLDFQEENALYLSLDPRNNKTTALENSSLINVSEILEDTQVVKVKNNFSEIPECLNIESTTGSETALSSFLSDRDKKILDSTPKQEFWNSTFIPSTAEDELPLKDSFSDANVLLENSIVINQKLSGDKIIKETKPTADAVIGVAEMPLFIATEKDVCAPWVHEDLKILPNQVSQLVVQNTELKNTTVVCQNTQDIVQSTVGTDGPTPHASGKEYSHFDKSTQTSEDILKSNNVQEVHQNTAVEATGDNEETITKVESSTRKDRPFTSPLQPETQTMSLVNNLTEQESTELSKIMTPAGTSEFVEILESNELPSCRPLQEKPEQMDQYISTYEHPNDSEVKLSDVNNVSPASECTNITSVPKQLKLNPKIRVFNESEDESSAEEDIIINTNKELRELSGIEPLLSGLEISTKEYFRDLERTKPRNRRPLSGSSSGSQSGYSTDTSVSESDSESINVYYFKIPEVSEPEDDS